MARRYFIIHDDRYVSGDEEVDAYHVGRLTVGGDVEIVDRGYRSFDEALKAWKDVFQNEEE